MTGAARRTAGPAALLAALALLLAAAPQAAAQGLLGAGSEAGPLKIDAREGIEWRRQEQVYIARGDATATRGNVTVYGDRLVAHYRKVKGGDGGQGGGNGGDGDGESRDGGPSLTGSGDTEIYRLEAIGSVRIVDDRAKATGDKAVYDLDQQVVVLTGDDLTFVSEQETITAEDSLEYWQTRDLAVARGDAVAVRGDRRIRADVLAARFAEKDAGAGTAAGGEDGGGDGSGNDRAQEIRRIEAFDNVRISTPKEYAEGDRGVYDTRTEVATLVGNVQLTRGENQLNGGWGRVNLKTGVSRLLGAPPDSGETKRVSALLKPDSAEDAEISETGQAEAQAEAQDGDAGTAAGSEEEP